MTRRTYLSSYLSFCRRYISHWLFRWGILACGFLFAPLYAASAQTVAVVAVVNGQAITNIDLENRLLYLLDSTGLAITEQNEQQLRNDVLQMLIDDKLKFIEAQKLAPSIIAAGNEQARDIVNETYKIDDKSSGQILREKGLERRTIEEKIASDLIWTTLVKEQYKNQFDNAEKLANQALDRLKADLSQPQVRLSEIVLAPTKERPTSDNLNIARQMIEAIRNGADFAAIARQYSASGSANDGGRLGWIVTKTLPDAFAEAIENAPSGAILEPINQDGIIYILRKEGVRAKGLIDPSQAKITLARALLPLPENASSSDQLLAAGEIAKATENASSCAEIDTLNTKFGSGQSSYVRDLELGTITPNLRSIVEKLEIGTVSEPLNFAEGMVVFMVCERKMPELDLPTLEELERNELNKIFSVISNRYLLRLRRAATIDNRIK